MRSQKRGAKKPLTNTHKLVTISGVQKGTFIEQNIPKQKGRFFRQEDTTMETKFINITLHESERADETWVNPAHIVAVTPDPKKRFMTVVLDVGFGVFSGRPKIYRITFESGEKLLQSLAH